MIGTTFASSRGSFSVFTVSQMGCDPFFRYALVALAPPTATFRTGRDVTDCALSTKRRQTGIVMDVHPVLRGITELRNSSFLGPNRMNNLLKAHT
jgi:hypothetical protein